MHGGHSHPDGDCCSSESPDRSASVVEILRQKGLRITEARRSMIRTLALSKVPLSADALHQKVGTENVDRVTVYRSLDAFELAGVVQRHPLEKGRSLYALAATDHHHHHLVCRQCGKIERLSSCDTTAIEAAAKNRGYTQLTHVLEIYGLCPTCTHG